VLIVLIWYPFMELFVNPSRVMEQTRNSAMISGTELVAIYVVCTTQNNVSSIIPEA